MHAFYRKLITRNTVRDEYKNTFDMIKININYRKRIRLSRISTRHTLRTKLSSTKGRTGHKSATVPYSIRTFNIIPSSNLVSRLAKKGTERDI